MSFQKVFSRALVVMALCGSVLIAKADVRSTDKNDPDFIKITQIEKSKVRFELCKVANESECEPIGNRDYSVSELNRARNALYFKAVLLVPADVVGIAVVMAVLGHGSAMIYEAVSGSVAAYFRVGVVGSFVGFVGGLITAIVVDKVNPFYQTGQARQFKETLILDQDISIKKNMQDYSRALDRVLKKLK